MTTTDANPTPPGRVAGATTLPGNLPALLDRELAFDTDAHHGFTNHLAMGLVAAARLGADAATLEEWYAGEEADGYLIRRATPPAWLHDDRARIERRGWEAEVRDRLPDLVERIGGFFHWMIRLELAIDVEHPGQIANALGDWQRRPHSGAIVTPAGTTSVAQALGRIGEAGWETAVADVRDHPDLLGETAAAVADLHWAVDDFTTLHLVTGSRAARAIATYLDDPADRRRLAHAHLSAVAAVASRRLASVPPLTPPSEADVRADRAGGTGGQEWDVFGRHAIATGDDHVVKLAYAAQLEGAATGRPIYRAIAQRAAGLG